MTQTIDTKKRVKPLEETISHHTEPIVIPAKHKEDLGPVSDMSPESWHYHPETIMEYYKKRTFQVFGRLFSITFPLGLFLLANWWDSLWGQSAKNESKRAIQLKNILTKLGPAYIKIGQALSTVQI